MKNKFFFLLLGTMILWCQSFVYSQDISIIGTENVNKMKADGLLTGMENYTNSNSKPLVTKISQQVTPSQSSTSCDCWIPRDASFQIAQFDGSGGSGGPGTPPDYRNDDWSTPLITLPFNICFYGQSVNQIYINNNGNISIGGAYSTFTALSFPDPSYVMIAPFWADVDTRGPGSGLVYYKVTPKYLIVQWEDVGYYNAHDDKKNTFQLIVTDGTDPIINPGKNIEFCYKDMQWTTGDASQGTNGFGGTPATVGVNQGNGIDYIQFGLFDAPGSAYDGAYGLNDGVDWLDNQSFVINACVSNANIPPVLNSLNVCDTIRICENSSYTLNANYLSPEQLETTTINYFTGGMTGINVVSNTPGNAASLVLQINGLSSNVGFHTISVTAIDNGTPVAATNNNFVIEVLPAPIPSFNFSPVSPVQTNTPITFTNTTPGASSYSWDFGDGSPTSSAANPQHSYTTTGTFNVTLVTTFPNGCTTSITQQITVTQCTPATFSINNACVNSTSTITFTGTASSQASYNWNFNGGVVNSGSGLGPYDVTWNTPGNYVVSLTVIEPTCTSTVSMPVQIYAFPVVSIAPVQPLCAGSTDVIIFNGTAGANAVYNWNFGNATVVSGSGAGPYVLQWNNAGPDVITLSVDENGCSSSGNINITVHPIPTSDFVINNAACINQPITLNYSGSAGAGANFNWSFGGGTVLSGTGQGPYSLSWSQPGVNTISLIVIENGCVSPQTDLLATVNSLPNVFAGSDQNLCSGASATIGQPSVAGETYSWTPAAFVSDPTISDPSITPVNNTSAIVTSAYMLQIIDANGCINSDTVLVTTTPEPVLSFIAPPGQCLEGNLFSLSATANVSGSVNYQWAFTPEASLAASNLQSLVVSYSAAGKFPVQLFGDYNGCPSQIRTDSITVYDMPESDFVPLVTEGCRPLSVPFTNLSTGNGNVYSWSFGDGNVSTDVTPQNVYENSGKYSVDLTVRNTYGCGDDTSFKDIITVFPDPVGNFVANPSVANILSPIIQFQNYSTNVNLLSWDLGDQGSSTDWSPEHTYNDTGSYEVTLMLVSPDGCLDTVRGIVRVERDFSLYVPNAFTPNGDGVNDYFRSYGVSIKKFQMNIYNRWGELIFKTDNQYAVWDGSVDDNPAQNEVFVYRIELIDSHDKKHTFLGNVSLIR